MSQHLIVRALRALLVVALISPVAACAAQEKAGAAGSIERVLVAGATGRTGQHIVEDLVARGYTVRAFVRDMGKAREKLGPDIEYAVGDVKDRATIDAAMDGVDALISAIGAGRSDPANTPEAVDYLGTKNLAEAAETASLQHIVIVSSAGVTHEDHVLNKMFMNVLKWKFAGEEVVRNGSVPYTIIRPGGLLNEPSGQKKLVFKQGDDKNFGSIPRADVARVCVAALSIPAARNKTFELISIDENYVDDIGAQFAALSSD